MAYTPQDAHNVYLDLIGVKPYTPQDGHSVILELSGYLIPITLGSGRAGGRGAATLTSKRFETLSARGGAKESPAEVTKRFLAARAMAGAFAKVSDRQPAPPPTGSQSMIWISTSR
jgi:hypothetical protein